VSCYLVQETDGSRFELEDESGFLLLEFCPDGEEYHPVGDSTPPLALAELPVRRGRRRRLESIMDEEEMLVIALLSDDL
jgi:hypothetical protein